MGYELEQVGPENWMCGEDSGGWLAGLQWE